MNQNQIVLNDNWEYQPSSQVCTPGTVSGLYWNNNVSKFVWGICGETPYVLATSNLSSLITICPGLRDQWISTFLFTLTYLFLPSFSLWRQLVIYWAPRPTSVVLLSTANSPPTEKPWSAYICLGPCSIHIAHNPFQYLKLHHLTKGWLVIPSLKKQQSRKRSALVYHMPFSHIHW